ncbi:MAG: elongation factor maturation arginine rhamnosyltransferase EarP [Pseudomonadota bacterium]|jgi:uncharacterized repeat protein (TIGR03837 family)
MDDCTALRWDVFCRVIDNHGDLGVCWRFASGLARRGHAVRLWVDDASALTWMAPHGHPGVQLRAWADPQADDDPGDVVVEAFACDPPARFVERMAARATSGASAPIWLNLEYLSAEPYVERSHGLASPQFDGPGRGLTKWFWFPGFTPRTGGLMRDAADLIDPPDQGAERNAALQLAGLDPLKVSPAARLALLFCYDNPALPALLDTLRDVVTPWCLLVTPGLATSAVQRWLTRQDGLAAPAPPSAAGRAIQVGALTLAWLPAVEQPHFDRLLRACDLNFVRGEDSFVRAHWAGRPFIWQAYVQDDGAHHAKVDAWLQVWAAASPTALREGLAAVHAHWNNSPSLSDVAVQACWRQLLGRRDDETEANSPWLAWQAWARHRRGELALQDGLHTQLLHFVAARVGKTPQRVA